MMLVQTERLCPACKRGHGIFASELDLHKAAWIGTCQSCRTVLVCTPHPVIDDSFFYDPEGYQ